MGYDRPKVAHFMIFVFSMAACGLLIGSAATTMWIEALGKRVNLTDDEKPPGKIPDENGKVPPFWAYIHFGLFKGVDIFNSGFTERPPETFSIFDEHSDVYSIGFPIAVFIFMLIALIFSLVSTIFGLVNTLTVPIETIHGPMGLYLWNAIGALACLMAWVLYLILYLTQLTTNVLTKEDMDPSNYFRTHSVSFGYSYWLVIASFLLLLVNIVFVFLAHRLQNPDFLRRQKQEADIAKGTNVGLGLMY